MGASDCCIAFGMLRHSALARGRADLVEVKITHHLPPEVSEDNLHARHCTFQAANLAREDREQLWRALAKYAHSAVWVSLPADKYVGNTDILNDGTGPPQASYEITSVSEIGHFGVALSKVLSALLAREALRYIQSANSRTAWHCKWSANPRLTHAVLCKALEGRHNQKHTVLRTVTVLQGSSNFFIFMFTMQKCIFKPSMMILHDLFKQRSYICSCVGKIQLE